MKSQTEMIKKTIEVVTTLGDSIRARQAVLEAESTPNFVGGAKYFELVDADEQAFKKALEVISKR